MNRRRFLLAVLLVAATGIVIVLVSRPREPIYQGKRLSEWVGELPPTATTEAQQSPAADAVRQIGTNGLPLILDWIQYRRPRLSEALEESLPMLSRSPSVWHYRSQAVGAFEVLGPAAAPAVPELTKLLIESQGNPRQARNIVCALRAIGADAALPLTIALTNRNETIRWLTAWSLATLGPQAKPAIPALLKSAADPIDTVRCYSILALGQIGNAPEQVMPVLFDSLNDLDPDVRCHAALAFGDFGKLAKEAVPELSRCLRDPDENVQACAIASLGLIGEDSQAVLPLLLNKLRHPNPNLRKAAARALGDFGDKSVVPDLLKAVDDIDDFAREAVFASLDKLAPEARTRPGKKTPKD